MFRLLVIALLAHHAASSTIRERRDNCPETENLKCPPWLLVADASGCQVCPPGCERDDEWYANDDEVFSSDQCETCHCRGGTIKCDNTCPTPPVGDRITDACENVACPELPCKEEIALQGECCLYCPPGCTMDDVWYDFGLMEVLDGDVCEECTCEMSGSYKCDYKECPDPYSLPCPSEAQFEGECCTECRPGCMVETNWYGAGNVESEDPCQTCTCEEDGSYGCVDNPCPELDCPGDLHIQGECCNSCPAGCFFEESWYGVGPMEQGDACQVCQCTEEGANCAAAACPPADCPEYAQVDGDCGCKVCPPGCRHNDNWYGVGVMEDAEKCGVCTCVDEGEYACVDIPCQPLNCPASEYMTSDDACCPSCPPGCLYKENWYGVGRMENAERCEVCDCVGEGAVGCVDIPCEPLACPSSAYITSDDACCPSCPLGCTYEENWYLVGAMDEAMECGSCSCRSDGSVSCIPYSCPPLPCPAEVQFTPTGECCPQCPAGCEVNANWYGASVQVPSEDPCDTCTCQDNGELDCQRIPCEQPGCSAGYLAAYSAEGACCPECLRSCRFRGKTYYYNQVIPASRNCRTCKCAANGRTRCERVPCPPLDCPPGMYPYTEYLACCPICKPMLK